MENKQENAAPPSPNLRVEHHSTFQLLREEMLTVREAAKLRGVTRSAIWDLIQRRRLRVEMIFGRALVYRAEVENFEPLIAMPEK